MCSHIYAWFSYIQLNFSCLGKIMMLSFDKICRLLLLRDSPLIWQLIGLRAHIMRNILRRRQKTASSLSDPPPAGCDWLMPNFQNDWCVFCTLHNTGITASCTERKPPRIDKYCDSLTCLSGESWVTFIYCKGHVHTNATTQFTSFLLLLSQRARLNHLKFWSTYKCMRTC